MLHISHKNEPLFSLKRRPHSVTHSLGTNENFVKSLGRAQNEENCAGEGQQQFTAMLCYAV
jgi:hypothetical protein